jgi:hypothetical protein
MYCRYKDSDEYLMALNMHYSDRWRNVGLLAIYIVFNMALAFLFFFLTKVVSWKTGIAEVAEEKELGATGARIVTKCSTRDYWDVLSSLFFRDSQLWTHRRSFNCNSTKACLVALV